MNNKDYLIIGQGIAGTTIAHQLDQFNIAYSIIDNNPVESSSKIASGLWNPVVLKRMKKVWRADEMLEHLHSFYSYVEKKIGIEINEDQHILRVLHSIEEQNNWHEHSDKTAFSSILNSKIISNSNENIKAPFGFGEVIQSGRINVPKYIEQSRKCFIENGTLKTEFFNIDDLIIDEDIKYQNKTYEGVIFCEGYQSMNNPWFKYLPFAPTKGEVLIGKSELQCTRPINGGKFLLPLGDKKFKIGATYDWKSINEQITTQGRDQLLEGWTKITDSNIEILKHQAGIRPNVQDRRPLLGSHPIHKNLFIFNGLGSRGILMAPFLSHVLVNHLKSGSEIPEDMNISRFKSLLDS